MVETHALSSKVIVRHTEMHGRINHSRRPYQCKAGGAFFSYAYPGFSLSWFTFLFPKSRRPI